MVVRGGDGVNDTELIRALSLDLAACFPPCVLGGEKDDGEEKVVGGGGGDVEREGELDRPELPLALPLL